MIDSKRLDRDEASSRLHEAQIRLKTLEQQAGIRDETERIAVSSLGSVGDGKFRSAVFAVGDVALRRQIMTAYRDCEAAAHAERVADDPSKSYLEVIRTFGERRRNQVAGATAVFAIFLILVGRWLGPTGEIIGAAVGIIWAVRSLLGSEEQITHTVKEHRDLLEMHRTSAAEWERVKPIFTDNEIATGEPDPGRR